MYYNKDSMRIFNKTSFVHFTCDISEIDISSKNEDTIRENVFKFFLTNSDGLQIQICKPFFLSTLGFKKSMIGC